MEQCRPDGQVHKKPDKYNDINRGVTAKEMREAREAARRAGLHRFDERWLRPADGLFL